MYGEKVLINEAEISVDKQRNKSLRKFGEFIISESLLYRKVLMKNRSWSIY